MPGATPHRTPLRRISQGSLFALSRSDTYPDAPHGLGFLEPVMSELVDEVEALQANVEGLKTLSNSLRTFNESFASFLYVMNMNALTTDWPQAPTDASFQLAKRRAEEDARAASAALQVPPPPLEADVDKTTYTENAELDTTFTAANATTIDASANNTKSATKPKKKVKVKLTAKERKERSFAMEKIVSSLPLEFRGNDPNLRRNMETVIEGLMDRSDRGVKLIELIAPPDLNQARVNKCLIALVNRKIVLKDNTTGAVLYHWQGLP